MKTFSILLFSVLITACTAPQAEPITVEADSIAENEVAIAPVEKVHVVKFFDYNCPHCRDAHFTVKNLEAEFGDKITVETKHFPLFPETFLVAETAECARLQGEDKFTAYHNNLMEENFRQYAPENLQAVAKSVGLNMEAFNTCVVNGGGKSAVQADVDEATSMGVTATPYFLINDSIPLPGAIPEKSFSRLIDQVLAGEVQ